MQLFLSEKLHENFRKLHEILLKFKALLEGHYREKEQNLEKEVRQYLQSLATAVEKFS